MCLQASSPDRASSAPRTGNTSCTSSIGDLRHPGPAVGLKPDQPVRGQHLERLAQRRPGHAKPVTEQFFRDFRARGQFAANDQRLQPVHQFVVQGFAWMVWAEGSFSIASSYFDPAHFKKARHMDRFAVGQVRHLMPAGCAIRDNQRVLSAARTAGARSASAILREISCVSTP